MTEIYRAREAADRRRRRQARRRCAAAGTARRLGADASRTARGSSPSWARPGDLVLTVGAGRRRARRPARPGGARMKIEEGVALARLTTIGTGGPARAFAKPTTARRARAGARLGGASASCRSSTVGLGSNLLAADDGVDALVLQARRRAGRRPRRRRDCSSPGGGATNAVCLHQARAAGLGGFEFACAIPGTAGGGVWMNAGAYGSDWSQILVRARVVDRRRRGLADAGRARALLPALGASARTGRRARSSTGSPRVRRRRSRRRSRADRAAQGDAADEQAHVRERLQEPGARARRRPDARGVRAQGPRGRRRA